MDDVTARVLAAEGDSLRQHLRRSIRRMWRIPVKQAVATVTTCAVPSTTPARRIIWAQEFRHDEDRGLSIPCPVCIFTEFCQHCRQNQKVRWTVGFSDMIHSMESAEHYRNLVDRYSSMWEPFVYIRGAYTPEREGM